MFIDTHCHISKDDYLDIEKVIKEDFDAGAEALVVIACEKKTIDEAIDIVNNHDNLYLAVGYHPDQVLKYSEDNILELEELIKKDKVVAIGEIGLDYYYSKEYRDRQIELFEKQLKIAEKYNVPVSIHSRDATEDTINILKKYKIRGVIHCFTGSLEVANIYIKMGFKLGIGGVVTFKNSNLYKVVDAVGLSNIVLETDSPYLSPEPFRGKKNTSANIIYIAKRISEILNVSLEDVYKITTENAKSLFDLNIKK